MRKYVLLLLGMLLAIGVPTMVLSQSDSMIGLYPDGHWEWTNGSPTPVVITTTPRPSQTPWIITSTPEVEDSPTPEIDATNTPTPFPSSTPRPECLLRNDIGTIRVRNLPSTDNTETLGYIYITEYVYPEAYYAASDLKWWKVWWNETTYGWTADLYTMVQPCDDVPYEDPFKGVALLWHTVPGFNWGNAQVSFGILKDKAIEFGIKPYTDMDKCIYTLDAGGMCIYRHGAPDCPVQIGEGSASESALTFLHTHGYEAKVRLAGYEKAYYEPLNECNYGDPNSASQIAVLHWWSDWLLTYVQAARAEGYPKLVIPTFGPSSAYREHYMYWKQVYLLSASYGNLAGEHIYTPYHDNGLCPYDIWLADRYVLDEQWRQELGIDINVAITEVAPGWGNDPVNVADFVCWYERVRTVPHITAVALWTMGYNPSWPNPNLDDYVVPISNAVLTN